MKQSIAIHTTRKQSRKLLIKPRKSAYVYHWDRITSAIAALLVMVGVVYGLVSWLTHSPQEGFDRAAIPPEAKFAVEDRHPGSEGDPVQLEIEDKPPSFSHAEQETMPAQVAGTSDTSAGTGSDTPPLLEETAFKLDNQAQLPGNKPLETQSPLPEVAQSTDVQTVAGDAMGETIDSPVDAEVTEPETVAQYPVELMAMPAEDEHSKIRAEIAQNKPLGRPGDSPDSADKALMADTASSPFQLKELKIIEPSVKRFLLTRSVSNREPQGGLSDISLNADGSAVVWAYSEVIDKKDSQFNYVWLHEGNRVARVSVKVRGNRWRSYSSKIINQSMSGLWRVEMQDGEGRLMASADLFLE